MTQDARRIALVTNQFPAGSEPCVARKFLALLDRGWDARIVCRRRDDSQWRFYPGLEADPPLRKRIHTNKDILAELNAVGPDLINFESGGTILNDVAALDSQLGCPIIVSFRGSDIKVHGLSDASTYAEVWRVAAGFHFVSDELRVRAMERGCPHDRPQVVIPSAVDPEVFPPKERPCPAPVGTPDRPLRVLSVGRLHWVKGYEYGLAAIRAVIDSDRHVIYRVVGEGDHRQAVHFDIYDLEIEKHVELLGAVPQHEVRSQMEWADVLLHPSISEGSPNVILEAFASGLPVVATDAVTIPSALDVARIVPRRDSEALARALCDLADQPDLRDRLSRAAQHHERWITASDQVDEFESFYVDILATRETP